MPSKTKQKKKTIAPSRRPLSTPSGEDLKASALILRQTTPPPRAPAGPPISFKLASTAAMTLGSPKSIPSISCGGGAEMGCGGAAERFSAAPFANLRSWRRKYANLGIPCIVMRSPFHAVFAHVLERVLQRMGYAVQGTQQLSHALEAVVLAEGLDDERTRPPAYGAVQHHALFFCAHFITFPSRWNVEPTRTVRAEEPFLSQHPKGDGSMMQWDHLLRRSWVSLRLCWTLSLLAVGPSR